jgi:excisionase family DNA binding protein
MQMKPQPAPALPAFLTPREVATRCRASLRTVRRWIADGRLPVHRLGRKVVVAEADLAAFLASCRNHAPRGDRG